MENSPLHLYRHESLDLQVLLAWDLVPESADAAFPTARLSSKRIDCERTRLPLLDIPLMRLHRHAQMAGARCHEITLRLLPNPHSIVRLGLGCGRLMTLHECVSGEYDGNRPYRPWRLASYRSVDDRQRCVQYDRGRVGTAPDKTVAARHSGDPMCHYCASHRVPRYLTHAQQSSANCCASLPKAPNLHLFYNINT